MCVCLKSQRFQGSYEFGRLIYGPVALAGRMVNGLESDRDLSCSGTSSRAWAGEEATKNCSRKSLPVSRRHLNPGSPDHESGLISVRIRFLDSSLGTASLVNRLSVFIRTSVLNTYFLAYLLTHSMKHSPT